MKSQILAAALSLALVSPAQAVTNEPQWPRMGMEDCARLLNAITEIQKYIMIMVNEGCNGVRATGCLGVFAWLHLERNRLADIYRAAGCHLYYQF